MNGRRGGIIVMSTIFVLAAGCRGGGTKPDGATPSDGAAGSVSATGGAGAAGSAGANDAATESTAGGAGATAAAGSAAGEGGSAGAATSPVDARDASVTGDAAADVAAPPVDGSAAACGACTTYGAPKLLANVQPPALNALSGATVGWKNPDIIFAQNDRNHADIYALGTDGALRAHYVLAGATGVDPEDLGVGPCPAGTCLFLADIGDNNAVRASVAIFRVTEPVVPTTPVAGDVSVAAERFAVAYEDGAHNAEGLLVEPKTGALYVVTKPPLGQPSSVYRLPHPLSATGMNQAVKVATLPVPRAGDKQASAAAAHPCGLGFVVRTYDALYEFRVPAGTPFEQAFTVAPVVLPSATEPQSEAVSYLADGRGIITSGEGAGAPIFRSGCAP